MGGYGSAGRRFARELTLAAALAAAAAGGARADADMAARIEAMAPDLEAYVARGMEMFDVPGVAVGLVTDDRLVYAKGFGVGRKGGGDAVGAGQRVPDRLDHQGVSRDDARHRRRSGQARLGRPRGRPLPRLPAEGSVGHAGVPGVRPHGAALGPARLRQRRGRHPRLRPAGDDPVAAPRRADLELSLDLHLHQHHPHARPARRRGCDGRRQLGRAGGRRRSSTPLGMGDSSLDRRGDRGRGQGDDGPRLDRRWVGRGPVHADLSLRLRRGRRDQLDRGRHGRVAAAAAGERDLRRRGARLAREPRGDPNRAGRAERQIGLRDGLDAPGDAERPDHLAQRRHAGLRGLRRHAARPRRGHRGADQPDQRRHAGRGRANGRSTGCSATPRSTRWRRRSTGRRPALRPTPPPPPALRTRGRRRRSSG